MQNVMKAAVLQLGQFSLNCWIQLIVSHGLSLRVKSFPCRITVFAKFLFSVTILYSLSVCSLLQPYSRETTCPGILTALRNAAKSLERNA